MLRPILPLGNRVNTEVPDTPASTPRLGLRTSEQAYYMPPGGRDGCAHEEHLVSAVHQNHRGEQQCKSLPRATQPQSQPAFRVSMTSWPAATPPTAPTSSRGGPGRAKRPLVSSSCSTACNTGNGASTLPCPRASASFCRWRTGTAGLWTASRSTSSFLLS